jgi:hypothetical protein
MQNHRQEVLRSANRRIQRGRKTTGRIVVSALGFAMAYYLDAENGEGRRKHLRQMAQRAFHQINAALAPDLTEPPPVFPSVLRTHSTGRTVRPLGERVQAAR